MVTRVARLAPIHTQTSPTVTRPAVHESTDSSVTGHLPAAERSDERGPDDGHNPRGGQSGARETDPPGARVHGRASTETFHTVRFEPRDKTTPMDCNFRDGRPASGVAANRRPITRFIYRAAAERGVKEIVSTTEAPAAVGAYSQATTNGELVFTAGQVPLTPDGELIEGSIAEQTERALENLTAVLREAGAEPSDVLKVTVFLDDIDDFDDFNEAYGEFFDEDPPARSAVGVGAVPKGAAVEIEAIATTD